MEYIGFHEEGTISCLTNNAFTKKGQTIVSNFFLMAMADFISCQRQVLVGESRGHNHRSLDQQLSMYVALTCFYFLVYL